MTSKTRRFPTPAIPKAPPVPTMVAIVVITFIVMLYTVSLFVTGTFDIGILMAQPGERMTTIVSHASNIWRMIIDPVGSGKNPCCGQGVNTTHPIVTVALGGMLSLLPKQLILPFVIVFTAGMLTIGIVKFIRKYGSSQWTMLLVAYFLAHPGVYEELRNPSFMTVKLAALMGMMTVNREEDQSSIPIGIWWFIALLFDPLLLLLSIPLFLAGYRKTVAIGSILYLLATIPYLLFPLGSSYRQVVIDTVIFPAGAFTVASIARFLPIPTPVLWIPITAALIALVLFQRFRKINNVTLLGAWMIVVTAISGATVSSAYLIVPVVICILLAEQHIRFTPFLCSAMLATILPSPIFWLRMGTSGTLLSSRDVGIAAVWTTYWSFAVAMGILTAAKASSDTMHQKHAT